MPANLPINLETINYPRNLVIGHFTRNDQHQIALGTLEGDIVVLSYEQGAVREVSRTRTEFWQLELRGGNFDTTPGTDLHVMGTLIWGENWPRPRVFHTSNVVSASTSMREGGRRRGIAAATETRLQMSFAADCVRQAPDRWTFAREGVFARAAREDTTIDAVFGDFNIHFRLTAPYALEPAYGTLTETAGKYSGTVEVMTSCGPKVMTVSAIRE